jgi:hypothetical protein
MVPESEVRGRGSGARGQHVVAGVFLVLLAGGGCDRSAPLYPVRGTVTLEDGSPLTRGMVVFESTDAAVGVTARGEIKADGSYQLSTFQPGDGVPPGRYRVQINPMDRSEVADEDKKLPYDIKYTSFETSALRYEVKPGTNGFSIRLLRELEGAN